MSKKAVCAKCIHKDVCTNSLVRLTLIEYGDCRHFIDEDDIVLRNELSVKFINAHNEIPYAPKDSDIIDV